VHFPSQKLPNTRQPVLALTPRPLLEPRNSWKTVLLVPDLSSAPCAPSEFPKSLRNPCLGAPFHGSPISGEPPRQMPLSSPAGISPTRPQPQSTHWEALPLLGPSCSPGTHTPTSLPLTAIFKYANSTHPPRILCTWRASGPPLPHLCCDVCVCDCRGLLSCRAWHTWSAFLVPPVVSVQWRCSCGPHFPPTTPCLDSPPPFSGSEPHEKSREAKYL